MVNKFHYEYTSAGGTTRFHVSFIDDHKIRGEYRFTGTDAADAVHSVLFYGTWAYLSDHSYVLTVTRLNDERYPLLGTFIHIHIVSSDVHEFGPTDYEGEDNKPPVNGNNMWNAICYTTTPKHMIHRTMAAPLLRPYKGLLTA
jgi:hypothetical protein